MEFPEIPGYTVIKRLGKGGMANIFLAEQTNFQRKVALKVMAPHLLSDPSFGERFLREARIVAQLSHPNFVPVYDVGRHGDYHYLSMEYLPGGDLKTLMREGLELAEAIRMVKEIASALNYAARRNFVHRDIKPENILLREDHTAVVCDFGIAKQTDSTTQMTRVGTVIGTPNYMSPEQAQAADLDGRSDLYSLGVIFFEMLTGSVPFQGDSAVSTGIMHVSSPIPRLPGDVAVFQGFIDKALAKRPEDRFQDGAEMIYALEDLEEQEYELIHAINSTVVISAPESDRGSEGGSSLSGDRSSLRSSPRPAGRTGPPRRRSRRRTGGGTGGGTGGSGIRKVQPSRDATVHTGMFSARQKMVALGVAATVGVGTTGWWLFSANDTRQTTSPGSSAAVISQLGSSGNFGMKAQELSELAEQAIEEGRLYGDGDDNAQAYLTSLLVLDPGNAGARASIKRLYGMYLEKAGVAIEEGDFQLAKETLNQASQIDFYIDDQDLKDQRRVRRAELIGAQQQSLIAAERARRIETLLAEAREFVAGDSLTSPAGANAYERYQEVLSLDPNNPVASEGIASIAGSLLERADAQIDAGELGRARAYINAAVQVYPQHPKLAVVSEKAMEAEAELEDARLQEERLLVEQREKQRLALEQERKQRQDKINSLLAAASEDIKAGRLNSPENNNAIDRYNQVIALDPANVEALEGYEKVAQRYIDIASDAIRAGRLDEAERNLTRAKILSPGNTQYAAVQTALIEARDLAEQKAAEEKSRRERIAALLKASELAAARGNIYLPKGSSALDSLRQVLELDSNNAQALAQQKKLYDQVSRSAQADIKARRFDDAQRAIAALVAGNAGSAEIRNLQQRLQDEKDLIAREDAERQRIAQQRLEQQRAERERLAREEAARKKAEEQRVAREQFEREQASRDLAARAEAERERDEQMRLSKLQEEQEAAARRETEEEQRLARLARERELARQQAEQQQREASQLVERTRSAIGQRDFDSAETLLASLAKIQPRSGDVTRLREDLAYTRRQQEQALEMLASADALTATPYKKPGMFGSNDKARRTLKNAYDKIQSARKVDPESPALAQSEQKLIEKYVSIITIHLEDEDADEAREFMNDLLATKLGGPAVQDWDQQVSKLEAEEGGDDRPAISVF